MKNFLLTCVCLLLTFISFSQLIQEQYASSVIAFSSEYAVSPGGFSAAKLLGAPDVYPLCGSYANAWTPSTTNSQREFFVLGFSTAQPVNTIRIYQTYGPGAVDTVSLRNQASGVWNKVYVTTASNLAQCPGISYQLLEISIPTTGYNVDAIRVDINSPININWKEVDAVGIANFAKMNFEWTQSAASVIAFSSQYSASSWSAQKVTGAPNVYPLCGDYQESWAASSADGAREWIEVGYTFPAQTNRVRIYQTYNPGAVDTVYLRNASTGTWNVIYSATAAASSCPQTSLFELNFSQTAYNVDAVRIALNSQAVASWNEIDAITLQTNLPPGAKFTQQTGNWSNTATWAGGAVPGAGDTVVIGNGHNVTLDGNFSIKSLFINSGGTLTSNANNTLTLGPSGGGKEYCQVQGTLNVSNGTIAVNGRIEFLSASTFTMSGGEIIVDGNDGTDAGSVAAGIHLVTLQTSMASCSFTGGMITIVDPQNHASGQAIAGNYSFGPASTVKFGNGSSITASNNPSGFGGSATFPTFGHFILDAATPSNNRHFKNDFTVTIAGNATIASNSRLEPFYPIYANSNLINNGTIVCNGTVRIMNDLTNNGTITGGSGAPFSVVHDFLNNASGNYNITSSYTSVGNNLVNDGFFQSNWLYFANDFTTSTNAQTIGGSGTFFIYGFDIFNNNPNGVTILLPLTIQELFFNQGKLFLGNNDLTLNIDAYGSAGSGNYVVINGTGKLIINNIGATPRLFPIGTNASYTPFTLVNGSGHNFSASIKSTFTNPPSNPAVVNREWNIADLTGGAVSADVTFQWNGADEDPTFNRSMSSVSNFRAGSWHALSSAGPASGTNPYTRSASGVTTFSFFGVGSNGALPVNLKSFTAVKNNGKVQLKWITANEVNLSHYDVERSTNGVEFTKLKEVAAKGLAIDQAYESMDNMPDTRINFYRLKQVDRDGNFTYSKIVKIDMKRKFTVFVYPNPARNQIQVQGFEKLQFVQLLDMKGRILKQWNKPTNATLDLGYLGSGLYQLRLITNEEIQSQALMIINE